MTMNFQIDENYPIKSSKDQTENKIIKIFNFNYSSASSFTKPNATPQSKPEVILKLIPIDGLSTKLLKNIKIEYSKDNKLLEKLFIMKNMVKIKKKSFI